MNLAGAHTHKRWKAAIEVLLGAVLVFGYIWCIVPRYFSWLHIVFVLMFLGLLFYSKHRRKESFKDLGLRFDNLLPSLKILLVTMLPVVIVLSIVWSRFHPVNMEFYKQVKFWKRLLTYPFWSFFQQYIFLAFFFRRFKDIFSPRLYLAIFFSGVLFSAVHIPNYPLMIITLGFGWYGAWFYNRYRNLIAISLFHGVMGTFFLTVLLMYLAIGPYTDAGRWTREKPAHAHIDCVANVEANSKNMPIRIAKSDGEFTVTGWAVGKNSAIDKIFIRINGKAYRCRYGYPRKDVAAVYHNSEYLHTGYRVTIPVSQMAPGIYLLKLKMLFKDSRYPHYSDKVVWVRIYRGTENNPHEQ